MHRDHGVATERSSFSTQPMDDVFDVRVCAATYGLYHGDFDVVRRYRRTLEEHLHRIGVARRRGSPFGNGNAMRRG
jgi:NADH:ubiquinone oxidoreductase subunit E